MRCRLAFPLLLALGAAGCPNREPPAYPVVRYEAEPFPPPDPRTVAAGDRGDAGTVADAAAPVR
jgi:hypothetical protein